MLVFLFLLCLNFLILFFFFFSFYLRCWCILCIISMYLNCASSHFVMTLTIKKSLQTKTNQNKCQLNIDCLLPLRYKKITIIKQNLDIMGSFGKHVLCFPRLRAFSAFFFFGLEPEALFMGHE